MALLFALPLCVVFLTGLVLAFEPAIVSTSIAPKSVDAGQVQAILAKHDPDGKLERIFIHPQLGTLVLGNRGGVEINLATGEPAASPSLSLAIFALARKIHETLSIDDGYLFVTISTWSGTIAPTPTTRIFFWSTARARRPISPISTASTPRSASHFRIRWC